MAKEKCGLDDGCTILIFSTDDGCTRWLRWLHHFRWVIFDTHTADPVQTTMHIGCMVVVKCDCITSTVVDIGNGHSMQITHSYQERMFHLFPPQLKTNLLMTWSHKHKLLLSAKYSWFEGMVIRVQQCAKFEAIPSIMHDAPPPPPPPPPRQNASLTPRNILKGPKVSNFKTLTFKITPRMPKMSQSNFVSLCGYFMSCNTPWLSSLCELSTWRVFQLSFKNIQNILHELSAGQVRQNCRTTLVIPPETSVATIVTICCNHRDGEYFLHRITRKLGSTATSTVITRLLPLTDYISVAENETLRALSGHTNGNIEMRSLSAAAMMPMVAAATIVRFPPWCTWGVKLMFTGGLRVLSRLVDLRTAQVYCFAIFLTCWHPSHITISFLL